MTKDYHRWLHRLAVLTVCAALPLLLLGAEVTTKDVGMVDHQGFRPPWHLLTVFLREHALALGFLIEHSHRLAGFIVGTCMIGLAVGLWRTEMRRGLRWLGVAALAGVSFQGFLGYLRVQYNALAGPELAFIHGCFAPLVFALLVSLPVLTSRAWLASGEEGPAESAWLRRWSLLTAVLVYGQIVLGAVVRRTDLVFGPRLHLLFAFVVVAAVVWLIRLALESRPRDRGLANSVLLLAGLVVLQLFLGVEAWLGKFLAGPEWPQLQPLLANPEILRSLHYLMGSLVFAAAVVAALQAQRRTAWAVDLAQAPARGLEGAL
jgi:cytochrome c oxidase assembly protein subunit 15